MIYFNIEFAIEYRQLIFQTVQTEEPFKSISEAIIGGNLILAILFTFLVNLTIGAFLTTTLVGVIFFIPILITVFRGWVIGIAYYGIFDTPTSATLALGTLIFELGAYVFSGAAGINIGLSFIFPKRIYAALNRWEAFKEAWRDAARLYVIVIVLLALGAIWEIIGIFLLIQSQ